MPAVLAKLASQKADSLRVWLNSFAPVPLYPLDELSHDEWNFVAAALVAEVAGAAHYLQSWRTDMRVAARGRWGMGVERFREIAASGNALCNTLLQVSEAVKKWLDSSPPGKFNSRRVSDAINLAEIDARHTIAEIDWLESLFVLPVPEEKELKMVAALPQDDAPLSLEQALKALG